MHNHSIVQITLGKDETLHKRGKPKPTRGFYMMGAERLINQAPKGAKPDYQFVGMNSIERLIFMSKREQLIIRLMINNIRWNKERNSMEYVIELTPDSIEFDSRANDTMPYSSFLKGFALLHAGDIMRRISKHKYMLNPDFLLPTGELAAHYRIVWQEAKPHPSLSVVKPVITELEFDDPEPPVEGLF